MPSSILSEANILAKLRHPGIPIVYDIEEDEAFYYIIEEYVEGESLEKLLWNTSVSQEYMIQIGIQLCGIVSFLHSQKPFPGFKTVAHYSMWESGKINRFWNCIIYYQSWKKLSELWNKRFCGTGAVRGI